MSKDINSNGLPSTDSSIRILELLPGFNCDACGYSRCDEFVDAILNKEVDYEACVFLAQEQYKKNGEKIKKILEEIEIIPPKERIYGKIDGYEADFILRPLPNENCCREIVYPFDHKSVESLKTGDIIKYRPFGCPIIHFAKVLEVECGLITIHVIGPRHRLGEDQQFVDLGICMVCGFEGTTRGKTPNVGETVRFLPDYCMMQKVHTGVIVQAEDNRVYIEGIDLKVWAPPISGK